MFGSLTNAKGLWFARLTDARSGLTVSGDFYDFIPITADRVGVVIGDVSGKGMPAALLMTSVRASVRAWADNGYCVSEVITRVNDSIWQDTSSNNFVTERRSRR